jgi:hypothetical protein
MKSLKTIGFVMLLLGCAARGAVAQSVTQLHITPTGDGFENYLAAAMAKKNVPVRVVERADRATLTLKASQVQMKKDGAGTKVMKCVFSSCAGIDGRASASVKLVNHDGIIVWSYSVSGDRDEMKWMAESIAKHLKSEYFRQ